MAKIYGTPLTMGGGGGSNDTLPPLLDNFKATRLEGGLVPPVSNAVAFKDIPDGSKIKLVKGSKISGTVTYGTTTDLNHRIVFDSNDWTRKKFQLENDDIQMGIQDSDIDRWLNSTKASDWWTSGMENRTSPDYANDEGFLYQLGITDELLAQNFNDININATAKANVGLPWVSSESEEIPYTFFENISKSDFAEYVFLYGDSGEYASKYDKAQTYAPSNIQINGMFGKIHPMMEPKPETPVALDSDGSYFMFEKQTSIILSADKMLESRANELAGAVWVYGDHEPESVNDGTKIQLSRGEIVTKETEKPPIPLNSISPSDETRETIVNLKESDGLLHPYIYLSHNYPTKNGCLLMRKDIYSTISCDNKIWSSGKLRSWCNDTFFNTLPFKGQILDSQIMGEASSMSSDKVFFISLTEMGITEPSGGVALGTKIDYFTDNLRRIAYYNTIATSYWTRSTIGTYPQYITSDGTNASTNGATGMLLGARPSFVLPNSFQIKATPNSDGSYDMYEDSSVISTFASSEFIVEKSVSWEQTKDFYARQFTYNSKKQYQTMLEGATVYLPIMPDGQELSKLPSKSKVKLGKFNGQALKWLVCRDSVDQSLRLILDGESVSFIRNKIFDNAEPSNSNSDRRQYGNNRYIWSNIHQWLNSNKVAGAWYSAQHSVDAPPSYTNVAGFLNGWTEKEIGVLENANWVVTRHSVDGGGSESFQSKVALPSTTEMGLESNTGGARIDIFNNNEDRVVSGVAYWCRTPYPSGSYYVRRVDTGGTLSYYSASNTGVGVRPLCKPLSNTLVSIETDSEGCFTLI